MDASPLQLTLAYIFFPLCHTFVFLYSNLSRTCVRLPEIGINTKKRKEEPEMSISQISPEKPTLPRRSATQMTSATASSTQRTSGQSHPTQRDVVRNTASQPTRAQPRTAQTSTKQRPNQPTRPQPSTSNTNRLQHSSA
jgi:hypothetical protein